MNNNIRTSPGNCQGQGFANPPRPAGNQDYFVGKCHDFLPNGRTLIHLPFICWQTAGRKELRPHGWIFSV